MYKKILNIYFLILSLFPIVLILESFFHFFVPFNTLIFIVFPLMIIIFNAKFDRKNILLLISLLISIGISFSITQNVSVHIHHVINMIIIILNLTLYSLSTFKISAYEALIKNEKIIYIGIILNLLINLFFLLLGKGFSTGYSASWGVKALSGIYGDPHQFAYRTSGVLMCIYFLVRNSKKKKNLLYLVSIIFIIMTLMSAARVPTLFAVVIEFLILKNYKIKVSTSGLFFKEKMFFLAILLMFIGIVLFGGVSIIKKTSIYSKMQNTISSQNFDNGRGNLRKTDIAYFNLENNYNKIFGCGAETTYIIHAKYNNMNIWSHNDFFQILISFGILGLLLYLYCLIKFCFSVNVKFISKVLILLLLLFVAFYNGLYIHQRFIVSLIFFTLSVFEKREKIDYNDNICK